MPFERMRIKQFTSMQLLTRDTGLKDKLEQVFLKNIQSGKWALNEKIPTEEALIQEYQASRSTIRRAMRRLEDHGLIEAVQGMGRTVVASVEHMSRTVGLLFPSSELELYSGIGYNYLRTLNEVIEKAGYDFAITAGKRPHIGPLDLQKLTGLMLIGQQLSTEEILTLSEQVPLVIIGHEAHSVEAPSFFVDYGAQTAIATHFLLSRGHTRIALTYGQKSYFYQAGSNMRKGYEWTLMLDRKNPTPELILSASLDIEGGRTLYRQVHEISPKITALISFGPATIVGMENEAASMGENLARELEIVCLNHLEEFRLPDWVHYFECPYGRVAGDAFNELLKIIGEAPSPGRSLHHPYCGQFVEAGKKRPPESSAPLPCDGGVE